MNNEVQTSTPDFSGWRNLVAKYQQPDVRTSVWQVINSFGGYFLSWVVMYLTLDIGYWLTLLLAVPAAGFLVRIFIIQHDCGHASFFKDRRVNDRLGMVCSIFTLVPYKYWRKSHAIHHAHHAELEERGIGDIWTMTVDEYWQASRMKRLIYRAFRNPFFLFSVAPAINFVIIGRFPSGESRDWKHGERASVWWTNLAIIVWMGTLAYFIGLGPFIAIQLPVTIIASSVGTFLFYVQHQFERTYWEHTPQWDYTMAALAGSSYYKLPKVLQWFTGNIGFHHIHHLSPRIPNYKLQEVHEENPLFQRVAQLTLRSSLHTVWLALWDEKNQRLITFREAIQLQLQQGGEQTTS
jgi:acyl-lipid omega-6 desaturase (Delta-12 desaturase)